MLRHFVRFSLRAATVVAALGVTPAVAEAQFTYQVCPTPGNCGWAQAVLTGTTLTVRLQNLDATSGSALYHAAIGFANPLTVTGNISPLVTGVGAVNLYGNASYGLTSGWSFDAFAGGLDVSQFGNVLGNYAYIEGTAPSTYRSDPTGGAYETTGGAGASYVEFTADIGTFGVGANNSITALSFDTVESPDPSAVVTPEPSSLALLGTGLFGVAFRASRRRRSQA